MTANAQIPTALVVPRNGLLRWHVNAIQRAEAAGLIHIVSVIESAPRARLRRDWTLGFLGALDAAATAVTVCCGAAERQSSAPLRERCRVEEAWPYAKVIPWAQMLRPPAGGSSGCSWGLILNLAGREYTARVQPRARLGVLEFRIGQSAGVDEVLDALRRGQPTITLVASLVGPVGHVHVGAAVAGLREHVHVLRSFELLLARATVVLSRAICSACTQSEVHEGELRAMESAS